MSFKASATSKRKDNSPQARLPWDLPLSTALRPQVPHKRVSECWPEFPFPQCLWKPSEPKPRQPNRPFQGGFPRGLGPTYPCPSTVHMETYSASVFCVLDRIIATTTKICTWCTIHMGSRRMLRLVPHAPPTQLWRELPISWRTIGELLEHRPFSGLVHSAGELLHTP